MILASLQTAKAMRTAKRGRLRVEDLYYILRDDRKKLARAKDLVVTHHHVQNVRREANSDPKAVIAQLKLNANGEESKASASTTTGSGGLTAEEEKAMKYIGLGDMSIEW